MALFMKICSSIVAELLLNIYDKQFFIFFSDIEEHHSKQERRK